MNYSIDITIALPRDEVIKKMDSTENMKHWQKGLVSAEHISGTPGEIGAKMQLNYKMGKRKFELIETITKSNFPEEFHATYSAKGMHNAQENFFEETEEGHTKWVSNCEFVPSGFMMRAMIFLMPAVFKKQSMKYMVDFKNFAEKGTSVADA